MHLCNFLISQQNAAGGALKITGMRLTLPSLNPILGRMAKSQHGPFYPSEVPGYQVYLCLAWLRSEGLVTKHERQGYTADSPDSLEKDVASRWKLIPNL